MVLIHQWAGRLHSAFYNIIHADPFLLKVNLTGGNAGDFQQIINEMRQLAHLTLQNDFGFPLNWVLGVFETKDMQSVEDRGQGTA